MRLIERDYKVEVFENKGMQKSVQTFMENTLLAILEYILQVGVDEAISQVADATEEDIRCFPHVAKALRDKGFLKGE